MSQNNTVYLLSIHGSLASKTIDAARSIHNSTAGAPANVAAARSLGDLSHMVYVPLETSGPEAGEFLILDLWNSMEGLNMFFANPTVQEQAGKIFSQRDPVVWQPADGFFGYHFPAPFGRNDRIVGVVQGMVHSRSQAQSIHNTIVEQSLKKARAAGNLSHEVYFRMSPPGAPESLEFFAVDSWFDGEGMARHYEDPEFMGSLEKLFAAPPMATVWTHPAGTWVEW